MKARQNNFDIVYQYGKDILSSSRVQSQKQYMQHGGVSIYGHCVNVACVSVSVARVLHLKVDEGSLVRGALLHDFFLYDWHTSDGTHNLHAVTHAKQSLCNAEKEFVLNNVEKDIIKKHMFPVNIALPRYKESLAVCIADKICAFCETFSLRLYDIKAVPEALKG